MRHSEYVGMVPKTSTTMPQWSPTQKICHLHPSAETPVRVTYDSVGPGDIFVLV